MRRRFPDRLAAAALVVGALAGLGAAIHAGLRAAPVTLSPTVAVSAWPAGGRLFANTVGLALAAALLGLLLAFPVGVHLGRSGKAYLAGLAFVPLFIPAHVAAYVWQMVLSRGAAGLGLSAAVWGSRAWAWFGAAWTLAALYWPVAALPVALALRLRGNRLSTELATLAPPSAVFWRAVVPGLAPGLAAGFGLLFLLALSNYGVPLMWNVPSQTVAAFSRLTAQLNPRSAAQVSLPLVALVVLVAGAGVVWLGRRPFAGELIDVESHGGPRWRGAAPFLAAAVLAGTVALPVVALMVVPGALRAARSDWRLGSSAFQWGLVYAALGATGATAIGLALAQATRSAGRVFTAAIEVVGLAALFVPAALLCVAFTGLRAGPAWLYRFHDSIWVFLLAYGVRYFYIPWRVTGLVGRFEGREHGEVCRLLGLGWVRRARLRAGGVLRPALGVSWLAVLALALGELEIAHRLFPPGRAPASVFLDQMAHYYGTAAVAFWSLLLVAVEVGVAWGILGIGLARWRKVVRHGREVAAGA